LIATNIKGLTKLSIFGFNLITSFCGLYGNWQRFVGCRTDLLQL